MASLVPLTFAGTLDRPAVAAAFDMTDLVGSDLVAAAWDQESALPSMTVGGLTRHLVSQPECAVDFLTASVPADAPLLGLVGHYELVDWLAAPADGPENTSIRDDFNLFGSAGHGDSVAVLVRALEKLHSAIDDAGPTTYVPWQNCALPTDDFLVVAAMDMVVHADDLACSVGMPVPEFRPEVMEPVLALLAALFARRHGAPAVLRSLSRAERTPRAGLGPLRTTGRDETRARARSKGIARWKMMRTRPGRCRRRPGTTSRRW